MPALGSVRTARPATGLTIRSSLLGRECERSPDRMSISSSAGGGAGEPRSPVKLGHKITLLRAARACAAPE